MKINKKIICIIILLGLVLSVFTGCGKKADEKITFDSLEDLAGLKAGVMTGTPQDSMINAAIDNPELEYFNDFSDMALALQNHKIDYYVNSTFSYEMIKEEYTDFAMMENVIKSYDGGAIFPKNAKGEALRKEMNEYIEEITQDGTLLELQGYWLKAGTKEKIDIPTSGPNGTLKMITSSTTKPFAYIIDGEYSGYDIAIVAGFCKKMGYGLEISDSNLGGAVAGVGSGKYDLAACQISYTKERAESVLYSDFYFTQNIVPIIRKENASDTRLEFSNLEELSTAKTAAVVKGTVYDQVVKEKYPNIKIKYYDSGTDMVMALKSGKVDFLVDDLPCVKMYKANNDNLDYLDSLIFEEKYHYGIAKNKTELLSQFNQWLTTARAEDLTVQLENKWISEEGDRTFVDTSDLTGENGVLKIGINSASIPSVYLIDGKPAGYNVDLIVNFCRDNGYGIEFMDMSYDAFIFALTSGKVDMLVSFMSYTDERAEEINFTDTIYEGGVAVLVRCSDKTEDNQSFWDKIQDSFYKSFVKESRWKQVLKGLATTMIITLGAFVLANIVGALFCAMNMSKSKFLRALAKIYSWFMQGTPVVVVLMILFYIFFRDSNISGINVAIIGFGIITGAYLAQNFEGAIRSIDKGQQEASLSLGFTRTKAFMGIILPQAIRRMLPGYFSQLISLMKGTAVVGYIAVVDLTKAGDIIRSSTYEAFFPLISVALIYLLMTSLFLGIMTLIQKKLAPKKNKIVKGVN